MDFLNEYSSIKHQIDNVTFDIYSPEEIRRVSVKQITNPQAFDNLNRPNRGGVYDPIMGVSAYDMLSNCEFCGLNTDKCPGHFGHIELPAPVYNPFMLKHILRLLNCKCFNCHKAKIRKKEKYYYYLKFLLLKLGFIQEAETLESIIYNNIVPDSKDIEEQLIEVLSNFENNNLQIYDEEMHFDLPLEQHSAHNSTHDHSQSNNSRRNGSIDTTNTDKTNHTLDNLDHSNENIANDNKDGEGSKKKQGKVKEIDETELNLQNDLRTSKILKIKQILKKITDISNNKEIKDVSDQNLNVQTLLKATMKDFWNSFKTAKCPHCNALSVKIKKQGNNKFFKYTSKKIKKKMDKVGIDTNKDALDKGEELASSAKKKKKQPKAKKAKEVDVENTENVEDDDESSSDLEEEVVKQNEESFKYLHPLEVREQVRRLWNRDGDLFSIVFGNVFSSKFKKFGFEVKSAGSDMFFLETILVTPNRFRPESKNGPDNAIFLHLQSQYLTKILNISLQITELSLGKIESAENTNINKEETKENKQDETDKLKTPVKQKEKESLNKTLKENKNKANEIISKWIELQDIVNCLYDSTKGPKSNDKDQNGIRQILEKKEGIFRMKMMGKRVNYAGRSVISPDPMINSNEVGIPLYIAGKLTFPEPVTEFNLKYLQELVKNGSFKYPETGQSIALDSMKEQYRNKMAENLTPGKQTVYRHLKTGDILLVNRQPTLHKPSIMSHRARVLPGEKTIRLHYANCSSYNADFDGDEMNIHLVQDHIARQEAYTISNTDNNYIVPTSGKPIRGLIQDSVVSAVFLTIKDSFFTSEDYQQLIYTSLESSLSNKVIKKVNLIPPAIIKPKRLWTGKQIITTILKSLITSKIVTDRIDITKKGMNMQHDCKLKGSLWTKSHAFEGTVIIRDNEMLTGILDKNHIGNAESGIIHSFYEIYGSEMAGLLISTFGRLFINYLQSHHGFTCGVDDLLLKPEYNLRRRTDIENIIKNGLEGLGKFLEIEEKLKFDNFSRRSVFTNRKLEDHHERIHFKENERKNLDLLIKKQSAPLTNSIFEKDTLEHENEETLKKIKDSYFDHVLKDEAIDSNIDVAVKNALSKTQSDRVDDWLRQGLVKRFPQNLFSMMVLSGAKGSLVNHSQITCMLGQQELEGKRVPRMASGKTLPSFTQFDPNPRTSGHVTDRFSTGIRPQEFFFHCMGGREGLIDTAVKTSRSGYLQRCLIKHMEQLVVNYDCSVRDVDGNIIQFLYGDDGIDTTNTKYLDNFSFISKNVHTYFNKYKPEKLQNNVDFTSVKKYLSKEEIKEDETLLSKFSPWLFVGSMSDKVMNKMNDFIIHNEDKVFDVSKNKKDLNNILNKNNLISRTDFKLAVYLKYMKSLVQPGDGVGIIASQSIGEPSTQMTLNTFHLAGHGAANMTLGIPRLREILMTSENSIKTPFMNLPLISFDLNEAKKLIRHFENYYLNDIVSSIKISHVINIQKILKYRQYNLQIEFEQLEYLKEYFGIDRNYLANVLMKQFIPYLARYISKQIKLSNRKNVREAIVQTKKEKAEKEEKINIEENTEKIEEEIVKRSRKKSVNSEKSEDEESIDKNKKEEDDELMDVVSDDEGSAKENGEGVEEENDLMIDIEEPKEEEMTTVEETKKKTASTKKEITYYSFENLEIDKILLDQNHFTFRINIPFSQKGILLNNILDVVLKRIVFKAITGIKKSHLLENSGKNKEHVIMLEGVNFEEVFNYSDSINVKKIDTNDIGSILRVYGIEACRASIVKEINNVFKSYHIEVDHRHLGLVADYMTYQGSYRSFNRVGMETASSPFLKVSFETSMNYLIQSCITKEKDNANSASARIVLGMIPKVGTGMFDVLQEEQ